MTANNYRPVLLCEKSSMYVGQIKNGRKENCNQRLF